MSGKEQSYALITGASKGIGRAFAKECAKRGFNLVIVSLPGEGLPDVAVEINKAYPCDILHIEADLTEPGKTDEIHALTVEKGIKISILINNAGFGTHNSFLKTSAHVYRTMMELNMMVLHQLINSFLPDMMEMKEAWILNMGSAASFMPGVPYKATYGASKSFVLSFSRGLQRELKNSNVSISCVCPGGVITNESVRKRIEAAGYFSRKSALTPEEVAEYAFNNRYKKKVLLIPGVINKLVYGLNKFLPTSFSLSMVEKTFEKQTV